MYPDAIRDALLFELQERRQQAAMLRLARTCTQSQATHDRRLRLALGSALLRLGTLVSGADAGRVRPSMSQEQ